MITDSLMDRSFIDKVHAAIEQNFENEQFGVDELAEKVGVSRSHLHRKLQAFSQPAASQLIKEFRLKKAHELLSIKVGTVAEVAYGVGFSSPSYFNTCFHDYYGYPPGKVKPMRPASKPRGLLSSKKSLYYVFFTSLIIILGLIGYIVFPHAFNKNPNGVEQENAIAVLPFKNLSSDPEDVYFADGITDHILKNLSLIRGLTVISRQSTERYRDSEISAVQIGEELGVDYFLEGSVLHDADKIRIIAQLIDAKTDRHIWSKSYDREVEDLFDIQTQISKQIALELNAALSPSELAQIEKTPTDNIEAYNLYLKGRYFWSRRNQQDLKISIKYFNQAVALDSSFALAYAGLGDAYYIMVWWGWLSRADGYPMAKRFIYKALDLDPMLAEAHAALGSMTCFIEYQWGKAEAYLRRAIELNPNYATGHQYYAEFLDVIGRNIEARKHINRALELNPMSVVMHLQSSAFYFRQGDIEKALELSEKAAELDQSITRQRWRMFKSYWMLGQDAEAMHQLHLRWQRDAAMIKYVETSKIVYDSAGIDGFFRWATDIEAEIHPGKAYLLAENYAMLGEKQRALWWLEKADSLQLSLLPQINNHLHFDALRSEPRFQALLEKMNLVDISEKQPFEELHSKSAG